LLQPIRENGRRRRRQMKILLVDDEPAMRELLRATLESVDIAVDEASSGLEAQARLRRRKADVVVLDLRMPGMSGVELCRALKANPRTADIPVGALTGAEHEDVRAVQRAGAAAVIRKPFSPLDLLSVIEELGGRTPVPTTPRKSRRSVTGTGEEEV